MYTQFRAPAFERDVKRCVKKHWDMDAFKSAVVAIACSDEKPIPQQYNDHALTGDKQGLRELHVGGRKSDWLVIYEIDGDRVWFSRTGTHDELYRR